MLRASLSLAASAVQDLEAIRESHAERDVAAIGDRWVRDLLTSMESLPDRPEMGRIMRGFNQPYLRGLILALFRGVYQNGHAQVRVVRVWRSERLLAVSKER